MKNNIALWCQTHPNVHTISSIYCLMGMELSMSIEDHGLSKRIPYDILPNTSIVVELDNMYRVLASLVSENSTS